MAATRPPASQSGDSRRSAPVGHCLCPAETRGRGDARTDVGHGKKESSRSWESPVTSIRARSHRATSPRSAEPRASTRGAFRRHARWLSLTHLLLPCCSAAHHPVPTNDQPSDGTINTLGAPTFSAPPPMVKSRPTSPVPAHARSDRATRPMQFLRGSKVARGSRRSAALLRGTDDELHGRALAVPNPVDPGELDRVAGPFALQDLDDRV